MQRPVIQELRNQLWDWSDRWKLNSDWCRKRAFDTLVIWSQNNNSTDSQWEIASEDSIILVPRMRNIFREQLKWGPSSFGSNRHGPDSVPLLGFGLPIWYSGIQTKRSYLAELEGRVKEQIANDSLLSKSSPEDQKKYQKQIMSNAKLYLKLAEDHIKENEKSAKKVVSFPCS